MIKEWAVAADPCEMQFNADGTVLPKRPAKSNAERQREFRRRNPDYYRLLQAKRRAPLKAAREARRLAMEAAAAATVLRKEPLMLPAPVETIEIPGMTTIPLRDAIPAPVIVEARLRDAA